MVVAALAATLGCPVPGHPQAIAPFGFIGIDGVLSSRSLFEEDKTRSASGGTSTEARTRHLAFDNEVRVMTHSYIYHPNFITLDLGGGGVSFFSQISRFLNFFFQLFKKVFEFYPFHLCILLQQN